MDDACIIRSLDETASALSPSPSKREIGPNQAVSIAARRGTVVRGERGTLWLTQAGHGQDYILIPGARYVSPEDGKIVVSSVGASGAVTIAHFEPGSESGFHGSPLRIDPAVVARLEREARSASGRAIGEWIARLSRHAAKALLALVTSRDDPALKHKA